MQLRTALAIVLKESYISQSDFAHLTGVNRQKINDFLTGRLDCRASTVEKFIQALTPEQRLRLFQLIGMKEEE
ncbi:helix-turn-helix transcriptional regulator [Limnospira sp. PMC 289.06]|uniref:helix-turn-helix domain-containing protein n=1 Tax=Limnospira sp. PMC 289.06 TaxID=2981094 RepID=UPI0028E0D761|nr:helix-turn-helix transcriptional regulator [Limnospira sp. PMC 289.06]